MYMYRYIYMSIYKDSEKKIRVQPEDLKNKAVNH